MKTNLKQLKAAILEKTVHLQEVVIFHRMYLNDVVGSSVVIGYKI